MQIKEFLKLSVGKWFAQRTSYHLQEEKADNSKSEMTIELLAPDAPELIQLCQQNQSDPKFTLATKTSWDNSVDWGKTKQTGATTIILLPDAENQQIGKLITGEQKSGQYHLGEDEALTLIVEEGDNYFTERIWFASENLRLRTTLVKNNHSFTMTAFYSEIRRVV
ncbi:MAG: phycobiliprotein lyase [Gomphosphaeria aponina SAG 52.96 = DSM 107014]|uniref:Chromophore lyase CpcS/CpeS n=1 Tax=Gomphosphaeria aponina SAG 52.96 = DSM 107014 TaxID=1521640 RepID=A0A941GTZ8_9CHRO|nr:phycobiliprotein lyase [Gomphosphaeria aponina SAG 52.96 = DSM 107014]